VINITELFGKRGLAVLYMILIISTWSSFGTALAEPSIADSNLRIETFVGGLEYPTSIAFLGPDDILVLEKNNGKVRRIMNNTLLPEPLIDLNVTNAWERGLLGIAISKAGTMDPNDNGTINDNENHSRIEQEYHDDSNKIDYIFLYLTKRELMSGDGGDLCVRPNMCKNGDPRYGTSVANYLYRYEFRDDRLVNPKLLLKIPASPGADHNGGAIEIGHDDNVYITSGDGDSCIAGSCYENLKNSVLNSTRSNFNNGIEPDGRGGILRITQDGKTVQAENGTRIQQLKGMKMEEGEGILGDTHPLNKYYAYGIRNSFGMDFDPVTGRLWDTENGAGFGDEINLVEPGFNSGWAKKQGVWPVSDYTATPLLKGFLYEGSNSSSTRTTDQDILVNFTGKGRYSPPEFTWNIAVAPTALKFYDSDMLGRQYENDMFVADFLNGNIYHFDLNTNRTALALDGALKDGIASNTRELVDVIFAEGFGLGGKNGSGGGITDIEVGPYDGYLYIVSYAQGRLYRVIPMESN
jgi:aldose sugar dehydrogenase